MAIDPGDAIILAYVLVSIGVIIVSLLAALPIGWLVDRLRARRLVSARGAPTFLRSDNGPEFVSKALLSWIIAQGIGTALIAFPP